MSYSDDSSDQDWKNEKGKEKNGKKKFKEEINSSGSKPKYSQRFCEKWMNLFHPWLARCEDDMNKPFCLACQCKLDCNRCHLQRHARTFKHARNLEILINKGESAARENLSIRQERSKYYQQRKKHNEMQDMQHPLNPAEEEYAENSIADGETNFQFVQTETVSGDQYSDEMSIKQEVAATDGKKLRKRKLKDRQSPRIEGKRSTLPQKKDRENLNKPIQIDKSKSMDLLKELIGCSSGITISQSPTRERNPIDLFFESVSSSVKLLTPKLIAEAKMRISQLVCELELRALTDTDGTAKQIITTTPLVVSTELNNSYIVNAQTLPSNVNSFR